MYQPADVSCGHVADLVAAATAERLRETEAPTIDQSQLDDMRETLGPAKLISLLEMAQSELAERPVAIRRIAESEDLTQLRIEAHGFKGAVANFGLVGVALAATAVELAAPGPELELALGRLDGEAVRARLALAPLICGEPMAGVANGCRCAKLPLAPGSRLAITGSRRAKPGHDQNESDD